MQKEYRFNKIAVNEELIHLRNEWVKSLTRPQDGMWESFRNNTAHVEIRQKGFLAGYACINNDNQLLQFYVIPEYIEKGTEIFKRLKDEFKISQGIVGTNNPIYLSIALHFVKKLEVHTYLFENHFESTINEKEGSLNKCKTEDLEKIVDFCHYSVGAPKEWLFEYIGNLIKQGEIFHLENNNKIIGTCEVRKSITAPAYADIGMIISPDFRKQGFGTYLLNEASSIALEWDRIPICSCEKDNIGSLKSIRNCGFISKYELLLVEFK